MDSHWPFAAPAARIIGKLRSQRHAGSRTRLVQWQIDQDADGRGCGSQMGNHPVDRQAMEIGLDAEVRHPERLIAFAGFRRVQGQVRVRGPA
ncbi:MAG: hypothetical protein DI592_17455 [Stenotrophomonas maltophilia]|nr:MAG: hypothetical protein DI592_17455 [Stenotrophomonas maltophilia]